LYTGRSAEAFSDRISATRHEKFKGTNMRKDQLHFLLLNIGHFLDHFFTLVFATIAALVLYREWGVSYAELLVYATPGFFAFGLFSLPAGWLADKWSRDGMIVVFFMGIGLAAIVTGMTQTPLQIGSGLFIIGMFAAIYHPVGLAIVTTKWKDTGMRIATNGVWGNLGVASAALIAGYFITNGGWRLAFILPGFVSIGLGLCYFLLRRSSIHFKAKTKQATVSQPSAKMSVDYRRLLIRVSIIVFVTTAISSTIFQATTFALPKIFDERLQDLAAQLTAWIDNSANSNQEDVASIIGALAFMTFAVASIAQLVVGKMLDRFGPRKVFMVVAAIQIIFFSLMSGLTDIWALAVALGFMIGAFGQIPINDYMIGKTASGAHRARIYGIRYVVSFTVLAASLPMIAYVYENWGFDTLFHLLAAAATLVFIAVSILPKKLPTEKVAAEPQPAT
jgi:MFS family permease